MWTPFFFELLATPPREQPNRPVLSAVAPVSTTQTPATTRPRPRVPLVELDLSGGLTFGATSWSTDPLGYGTLDLGVRLWRIVTPYVSGALGYARIDQRLLTRITVGVSAGVLLGDRFFPRVYAAFVHQHEESLAAVAQEPFGAVLGIGSGIRHRAGVHVGLGLDVRVFQAPGWEFSVGPEASFMYLTYSSGPNWYGMGGARITARVQLL